MGKSRQDSLAKSERKLDKKVQFYSKVRDTVASLNAQKSITKVFFVNVFLLGVCYTRVCCEYNNYEAIHVNQKNNLRSRQKKLKAYDLTSLSDFLPELKATKRPIPEPELKLNCKSRQKIILKERKQLHMVLNHAAFRSDPLEAIHQHLQSTQPVVEEKPKKKANKNGSRKAKEKKLRGSAAPQSMDL
ncbi:hypothetical protein Tsubulata_015598 [Turnera subulata]|uniref:Ribosome biogenesis protein slx9-like n=1 Tax=Turnera subulata TaxID=218843 RepID=A0A9Q0FFX1_9ROSI|nr:hypothetical protein Tsubulata_015598 [Turnera subulata]